MIQNKKQPYVPSTFTLSVQQTFGNVKRSSKGLKMNRTLHQKSDSKMPRFILNKKIYDKQNLLHQLKHQKQRSTKIRLQSRDLKNRFTSTKNKLIIQYAQTENVSFNCLNTIKRQIQTMIEEIASQKQQIESIKRSKKYNRYMELVNMRSIYLQQITSLKQRLKQFKYYEKEQKKIIKQNVQRKKKIKIMNRDIQAKIVSQAQRIQEQIIKKQENIRQSLKKGRQLKQIKYKLVKDILLLQNKTGEIYITQESVRKNEQRYSEMNEQFSNTKEKLLKQTKDTQKFGQIRQNVEEESYEESQQIEVQQSEEDSRQNNAKQFIRSKKVNSF